MKDELIRAMKESNSSMRLDSLVLVRRESLVVASSTLRGASGASDYQLIGLSQLELMVLPCLATSW